MILLCKTLYLYILYIYTIYRYVYNHNRLYIVMGSSLFFFCVFSLDFFLLRFGVGRVTSLVLDRLP